MMTGLGDSVNGDQELVVGIFLISLEQQNLRVLNKALLGSSYGDLGLKSTHCGGRYSTKTWSRRRGMEV